MVKSKQFTIRQIRGIFCKKELATNCIDVYTSEANDHGIDIIARFNGATFTQIQVKSIRESGYIFIKKTKWDIYFPNLYYVLLVFREGMLPDTFLISSTSWKKLMICFAVETM